MRQACFPKDFAFPKTVEQVVPSRKRMKSKTKPEEPRKREVKFVCQAEHWESALQSRRKTRAGPPNVVSQSIGFLSTRTQACVLGHCFQEFMQKAEECVAEAHGLAEHERSRYGGRFARGEISSAHCGPCTKTLSHQTMSKQARKLLGNNCSAYHRLDQTVPA